KAPCRRPRFRSGRQAQGQGHKSRPTTASAYLDRRRYDRRGSTPVRPATPAAAHPQAENNRPSERRPAASPTPNAESSSYASPGISSASNGVMHCLPIDKSDRFIRPNLHERLAEIIAFEESHERFRCVL